MTLVGRNRTDKVTTLLGQVLLSRAGDQPLDVVVDGPAEHAATFADALAVALAAQGREILRLTGDGPAIRRPAAPSPTTVVLADGPYWRTGETWDAVIYLRTAPRGGEHNRERGAQIIVDYHDPAWPIVRHIDARLVDPDTWHIPESRAFFAPRAATWDTKFGDDLPAYAAAVTAAGLPAGATVLDLGCGTGRALPALRAAVGPTGTILGVDITPEMLAVARRRGDAACFALVLADARHLPLADRRVDAIFAAGLIQHLPDPQAGLTELARITRPGGSLIVFHPSGRAALAARHGRVLHPDEPLSPTRIGPLLATTGWQLTCYDDPPHRFFATATRRGKPTPS
ncbi:class I SAM-dependent methyltransferase [Cryptosporangium sp. NPDC048952]|uniref:class I SAM-dependent methyltransferase n=1 Tax=Cryptosporangium sp. NPDC048952 TaxID=3363961 RepID=UPI003723B5A7